jgi:5-formyltetrahydrofolate cyclo-ligase
MASEGDHRDLTQTAKVALRRQVLEMRSRRSPADRTAAGAGLATVVRKLPRLPGVVAAYLAVGTEPETSPLLTALHDRGVHLIVPVLKADNDLDWVRYRPGDPLRAGLRGTVEPVSADVRTLADAELILVPALAADHQGYRLGRGGGSYDRALVRRSPTSEVFAVLYDDEVLVELPTAAHDVTVTGAITPAGLLRLP